MKNRSLPKVAMFVLLLAFAVIPVKGGSQNPAQDGSEAQGKNKGKTVYVCACLKNKSCSCMTEAKMEGPCACGTQGGPPMKAVPANSDWAKQNRDAMAK